MNKKNKILVGCLALLLVLSVGYAYFSDTITINGTAKAKGNFDITATCETGISAPLVDDKKYIEGGYENDTCSVVDDTVSFSTNFLYPGARRQFTVKYTNTGTIDAVLDPAKLDISKTMCVADNLDGDNKECISGTNTDSLNLKDYAINMYFRNTFIFIEDKEGNLIGSESDEFLEFVDTTNNTFTLKPGYSIYVVYGIWFNHANSTQSYSSGEMNVEFTSTFTYPFEQATD